jgi:hypothetical protein
MKNSNLLYGIKTRGGGPNTEAGKSRSSRNSTKHGIYSPTVVLPSESEFEFNALKQQLIDEYSPRDTVQLMLVHDLAVLVWKKRRLESLEYRMISSRIDDPISSEELQDELMFFFPKDREWILDLLCALTEEFAQIHQHRHDYALKMIKQFQMLQPSDLDRMKTDCPSLEEFIQMRAEYRMLLPFMRTSEGLLSATVSHTGMDEDDQSFLRMELYRAMDESSQILWGYEHLSKIERGIEKIRDKRHMQMNYRSNTHRLYEELGKSMARTCSELSRHQSEYQGSITQGSIHPHELIGTDVEIKSGGALLGEGEIDIHAEVDVNTGSLKLERQLAEAPLPNLEQLNSSALLREEKREAGDLKNLINLNKNCERALHLESLRNRRLFKMPQFTKRTRSH